MKKKVINIKMESKRASTKIDSLDSEINIRLIQIKRIEKALSYYKNSLKNDYKIIK